MKNIDFLPARYRERRTARKSHLWRVLVVAAFGAAVGATAIGQYWLKQSVASQVQQVEQRHAVAQAKNEQFIALQRELQDRRAAAQLFAYLKHPWPRTQILAVLAATLPADVTLNELTIANEVVAGDPRGEARGRARSQRDEQEADARLLPAERDLKQLRRQYDEARTVVYVVGRTGDIPALHRYVASLGDSPLFAQAELTSMEAVQETGREASEFHLRLVVVAAHGQAEAPLRNVAASGERSNDG
ncbi:MAG: PilN domain-containing protein [Pirellulaceae bacterium]